MQKRNQDFSVKLLKFYMLTSFILINFFIIRQVFYLASSLSSFYFTKKASPAAKPFLYFFFPAFPAESFHFSFTGFSVLRNGKRLRSFRPEPFLINQYLINSFIFRPQTADRHKTASATSLCPQSFPAYPPVHEARSLPL